MADEGLPKVTPQAEKAHQPPPEDLDALFGVFEQVTAENDAKRTAITTAGLSPKDMRDKLNTRIGNVEDEGVKSGRSLGERLAKIESGGTIVLTPNEREAIGIYGDENQTQFTREQVIAQLEQNRSRLSDNGADSILVSRSLTVDEGDRRQNGENRLITSSSALIEIGLQETGGTQFLEGLRRIGGAFPHGEIPHWCVTAWRDLVINTDMTNRQALEGLQRLANSTELTSQPAFAGVAQEISTKATEGVHKLEAIKEAERLKAEQERIQAEQEQKRQAEKAKEQKHTERETTLADDTYSAAEQGAQAQFEKSAGTRGFGGLEALRSVELSDGGERFSLPLHYIIRDGEMQKILEGRMGPRWDAKSSTWTMRNLGELPGPVSELAVLQVIKTNPDILQQAAAVAGRSMEADWTGYGKADYPDGVWDQNMRELVLRSIDGYAIGILKSAAEYKGGWGMSDQDIVSGEGAARQHATIQSALDLIYGQYNPGNRDHQTAIAADPYMKAATARIAPLLKGESGPLIRGFFTIEQALNRAHMQEARSQHSVQIDTAQQERRAREERLIEGQRQDRRKRLDDNVMRNIVQADRLTGRDAQLLDVVLKYVQDLQAEALRGTPALAEKYVEIGYEDTLDLDQKKPSKTPRLQIKESAWNACSFEAQQRLQREIPILQASDNPKDRQKALEYEERLATMEAEKNFLSKLSWRFSHMSTYRRLTGGVLGVGQTEKVVFDPQPFTQETFHLNKDTFTITSAFRDQVQARIAEFKNRIPPVRNATDGILTQIQQASSLEQRIWDEIDRSIGSARIDAEEIVKHVSGTIDTNRTATTGSSSSYLELAVDNLFKNGLKLMLEKSGLLGKYST